MVDGPIKPEEQYFLAREARLRERLRAELEAKAAGELEKRQIAENLGSDDEAVIDRIQALGLESEALPVLHLLPLVGIAWADGTVSERERATILAAAEVHGIKPETAPARLLAALLEERPSETLRRALLGVLKDVLSARGLKPASLLQLCEDVASASGGLLGFGNKVSSEERQMIADIAAALGPDVDQRVKNALDS